MHDTKNLSGLLLATLVVLGSSLGGSAASAQAVEAETPPTEMDDRSFVRVDVNPFAPGFVHTVTERQDRLGLRMQLGLRAVFDGANGAYLDGGINWFFSGGSGLGWSGSFDGRITSGIGNIDVAGTLDAGYLRRFTLDGDGRHGLAIDLGAGLTAAWIGAQISPGTNALASIDYRNGTFVIGGEARGRLVAWFVSGGVAEPLVEYQAVLRIGFGFGG